MRIPPVFALLTVGVVATAASVSACGGNSTSDPGQRLFQTKGCAGCHGSDGEGRVGPSLIGLFGSETTVLDPDGNEVTLTADDAFIRESIIDPGAYTAPGFVSPMPPANLSDEELDLIVGYIESIGASGTTDTTGSP